MNAFEIIDHFYPQDLPLRRMLLEHSTQVRGKAMEILENPACATLDIDRQLVAVGAMLHDIGIRKCHAPKILCTGSEPYIAHGVLGAQMLREYGETHGLNLEFYIRICERHTGCGITADDVRRQGLPIPERDYQPETLEEKLVCLADKFFSKSGDMQEKPVEQIRRSMFKFGASSVERFDELYRIFILP